MKTNSKKKILVSTLALAMGAGLAGSISGSVAWYQYSTRTAASFVGTSAGTIRNLQISKDNGANWSQYVDLATAEAPFTFRPVSAYGAAGSLTFVDHPVYQYATLPALNTNVAGYYAEYNLVFKCEDTTSNGQNGTAQVEKAVYLSHFNIADVNTGSETDQDHLDITPAVRVEIIGETNSFIISKAGGTTNTSGKLDLNGNGKLDTDEWNTLDATAANQITYMNNANGLSYKSYAQSDVVVNTDDAYSFSYSSQESNPQDPENPINIGLTDRVLTTTQEDGNSAAVTIRVWIEGWQALGEKTVWDKQWLEQNFRLELQFACEADR